MSRTRPVTYLSIEQLAKLSTPRLRAYKRRLKIMAGGKDDPDITPTQWIKYTKVVDRMVQQRRSDAEDKLSHEEWVDVILGYAELEGFEVPIAQKRARKRLVARWDHEEK